MSETYNDGIFATRRQFLAGTAAAVVALQLPRSAHASGFHTFRHGAFDITVVSDGFITLPAEVLLPDASPDERARYLKRLHGNASGAGLPSNIPLIRTGKDLILIDNGGGTFQPSDGKLAENLKTLGVSPEDITKVVFTHVHPDHSGATTTIDGKVRYPNAQYYVGEAEWMFWTDKDFDAHQPSALHGFAEGAKRDLFAVKDRLTIVKPEDEIISGMSMVSTRGHTPGHMSVEIAGAGGNLLVTGDACTSDITFFENPDWHFGFDTEPEIALKNRQMLLDRAASEKIKMLGFHRTYPGVGYAARRGRGYQFVPA